MNRAGSRRKSVCSGVKLLYMPDSRTNAVRSPVETAAASLPPSSPVSILWMALWYSVLYWPVTIAIAARKQFWNDELFTYYISALGTFARIWTGLLPAADQNPPLFYWLSGKTAGAVQSHLIGLRLPEMFGFWLMGICLIIFLSRQLPAAYGLVAGLIPLVSGAYWYACEARPYGIVIGLAALALICWQRTEARRVWWAAGLGITLGLAISVHYYSVLLFLPLAGGEACRSWVRRRPNWPVWLAFTAGAFPLLVYLPLIRNARSYSGTFWAKAEIGSINGFLSYILAPALLPLTLVAVCAVLFHFSDWYTQTGFPSRKAMHIPLWEIVVAVGVLSVVPFGVFMGKFVTGAYTHRYVLSGVIGLSMLAAWMVAAAFQMRRRPAIVCAVLLSCFFLFRALRDMRSVGNIYDRSNVIGAIERLEPGQLAVVVADPHLFFELSHQAPEGVKRRLVYVAEPKIALRRLGTDTVDRGMEGMQSLASLQVKRLDDVTRMAEGFLIIGYPATWGWLVEELSSLRVPLSVTGSTGNGLILLAEPGRAGGLKAESDGSAAGVLK